jgi:hypothetical protein
VASPEKRETRNWTPVTLRSLRRLIGIPRRLTAPSPNYRTAANSTIISRSQKPIDRLFLAELGSSQTSAARELDVLSKR